MRASNPPQHLPDVNGSWDGFFLAADDTLGGVESDIAQDSRRLAGDGIFFNLESGGLFNTCNFNATLPNDAFMTGTGVTSTGRLVFQAELGPFGGLGGHSVMAPEFRLVPRHGNAVDVSSLLLRSFPGAAGPDIAGGYLGPFVSVPDPFSGAPADPAFTGIGSMQIAPRNARGSFAGRVDLFLSPNASPFISWPFRATTDENNRVIWIAHGRAGRIVYDGVVVSDPGADVRLDGVFRINFFDGRRLFNAYNCSFALTR
jgi:hypothetical protein